MRPCRTSKQLSNQQITCRACQSQLIDPLDPTQHKPGCYLIEKASTHLAAILNTLISEYSPNEVNLVDAK